MRKQIRERPPEAAPVSELLEADLRFLDALLNGIHNLKPLTETEKLVWLRTRMPKTYALLAASRHWPALADLPETIR